MLELTEDKVRAAKRWNERSTLGTQIPRIHFRLVTPRLEEKGTRKNPQLVLPVSNSGFCTPHKLSCFSSACLHSAVQDGQCCSFLQTVRKEWKRII
jgi:hypothetical protein